MAACLALAEKAMPHLRLAEGGRGNEMPVYKQQFQSGVHTWKRWNALAARGIDVFYNSTDSKWHYPIYDVHGNVKATLHRDGSTDYDTANWKQCDVCGGERSSNRLRFHVRLLRQPRTRSAPLRDSPFW